MTQEDLMIGVTDGGMDEYAEHAAAGYDRWQK